MDYPEFVDFITMMWDEILHTEYKTSGVSSAASSARIYDILVQNGYDLSWDELNTLIEKSTSSGILEIGKSADVSASVYRLRPPPVVTKSAIDRHFISEEMVENLIGGMHVMHNFCFALLKEHLHDEGEPTDNLLLYNVELSDRDGLKYMIMRYVCGKVNDVFCLLLSEFAARWREMITQQRFH